MKKLRIAQVAPVWFPIPPKGYGGTERIVSYLTETLVERGQKVTLFATGNSQTRATLVATRDQGVIEEGIPWSDRFAQAHHLSTVFQHAAEFDIIHSHMGLDTVFFQPFTKTPVVHTMHNIIDNPDDWRWELYTYYKNLFYPIFISKREQENAHAHVRFPRSWVVYNGIDLAPYTYAAKPKNQFSWIARVSKEKGIENAIAAAERASVRLVLAGQIQPFRKTYFETVIQPHLSDAITYAGEIPQEEMSDFYGSARALLYPIEWEEPFGLVVVEAMACGTPVIAFRRGAMPEIIEHGKNGFLVDTVEEMVEAMRHVDEIDRKICRKTVEKKFSKEIMAANYERVYEEVLAL